MNNKFILCWIYRLVLILPKQYGNKLPTTCDRFYGIFKKQFLLNVH